MAMSAHESHRKDQYKAKTNSQWKEKFKQKCLQTAKQSKMSLLQRLRETKEERPPSSNVVNDMDIGQIVRQEWSSFVGNEASKSNNTSSAKQIQLWSPEDDKALSEQDYFDIIHYLEQEITEELKREGLLLYYTLHLLISIALQKKKY